ncbi:hypothetical protein QR680_006296 [Steinernema hermaphroditum]|uniref:Uncharacterized protein n=1 Tax=Steinernema hermaphroditum TaxID=289476 RepID=A0AA39HV23_9BILA|nr:hypothetical protein QR680_006296 [Steinernema hermaphroditum]
MHSSLFQRRKWTQTPHPPEVQAAMWEPHTSCHFKIVDMLCVETHSKATMFPMIADFLPRVPPCMLGEIILKRLSKVGHACVFKLFLLLRRKWMH